MTDPQAAAPPCGADAPTPSPAERQQELEQTVDQLDEESSVLALERDVRRRKRNLEHLRLAYAAPKCEQVTTAGSLCQNAALRGQPFCRVHSVVRQSPELPFIEHRDDFRLAIRELYGRVARGEVSAPSAKILLKLLEHAADFIE